MSCFVFFFQLYSSTKNSFSIIVSPWRGLCPSIWINLNPFHVWFQSRCTSSGSTSLHQKFGRREKVFLSINISFSLCTTSSNLNSLHPKFLCKSSQWLKMWKVYRWMGGQTNWTENHQIIGSDELKIQARYDTVTSRLVLIISFPM